MNAIVPIGANALVPQDMDQAIRLAKAMSSAKLVPRHLHDDVGSCLMIVEQAMRWKMSPFAVAQCTSVIGGKMMFEGKLVAAAVECSGVIAGGFDYQFDGTGDDRKITVSATRAGEREPRTIEAKLRDVRTDNGIWKKQPDQQLVYAGTRIWARRWAPAVLLGVYAPEEFDRASGSIVTEDGATPVIEGKAEPSAREAINKEVPLEPPAEPAKPTRMTIGQYLDSLEIALRDAGDDPAAINAILDSPQVLEIRGIAKGRAKERLDAMLADAAARAAPAPDADAGEEGDTFPGFAEPATAAE